jgi:hypothetical protein
VLYVELKGSDVRLAELAVAVATEGLSDKDASMHATNPHTSNSTNPHLIPSKHFRWIGFNLKLMQEVKRLLPHHKVYLLAGVLPFFNAEANAMKLVDTVVAAGLDGIDLNADEVVLTKKVVSYAHCKQLDVVGWVYPGTVRVFRQKFTLEDHIGSHAFLSGVHCSYRLTL